MQNNKFLIPGAVVVAGLLIAGAVFFAGDSNTPSNTNDSERPQDISIRPITEEDHLLGSPDAEIKFVTYSDIDCPYCASFHQTMTQIMEDYGSQGEVAWIYRHFPLSQAHPDAMIKAEASECLAELEGESVFWRFMDIVFERDEDRGDLIDIALELGADQDEFEECLDDNRFRDEVLADFNDGRSAGVQGTPHSVIVIESTGEKVSLEGAQPYSSVRQIIEAVLEEPETAPTPDSE